MADSLTTLATKLPQIILPIIIVIGVVGNVLNIIVLTRPTLKHHACSYYFLTLGFANLFSCILIIDPLLSNGYQIYLENSSLFWCKVLFTIQSLIPYISAYSIVLASFDRFCASSTNGHLRSWSKPIIARRVILIMIIFWCLFHINTLVLSDLRFDDYLGCNIRTNAIYSKIYISLQTILYTAAPCLMALFGILTIFNTKRVRLLPTVRASHRRTEGQLIRMLLLQVATYVILNIPLCVMVLIMILPTGYQISASFSFAFVIIHFSFTFSYVTPIFLFVLSARVYREVFFRLIYRILRINNGISVHPMTMTMTMTNGIPMTKAIDFQPTVIHHRHHMMSSVQK